MSSGSDVAPLLLQLFGSFRASRDNVTLSGLHRREGERLLAFLILHSHEPIPSIELARRFFPSEAQVNQGEQGDFPNLRQALRSLRQALGSDSDRLTRPTRASVLLDLTGIETDVRKFDRLATVSGDHKHQAYVEAVGLYQGDLLSGWNDSWVLEARRKRRRTYENMLRYLAQLAGQNGKQVEAEAWMRRLLAARPEDEENGRALLRLLIAAERYAEATDVLHNLQKDSKALEPETEALVEVLRRAREAMYPLAGTIINDSSAEESQTLPLPQESAGGAVPVDSPFYIERDTDATFAQALAKRSSIVLVKGARQVGKTSLLARGLHHARQLGAHVILTDYQKLNTNQLESPDALYRALAAGIVIQLGLSVSPRDVWDEDLGPNMNMELFLQLHVLPSVSGYLIWGMDEVDRLFTCPFGSEVFGLFRSWHNERSLNPTSPMCRLTLAIAYATEAHLFITDLNQSPFNVGTRLALADFTAEQVAELNRRYGSPFSSEELSQFQNLIGGQPYLMRCGLDQAVAGMPVEQIITTAEGEDGIFADHLRRLLLAVSRAPHLVEALRSLIAEHARPKPDEFYRLRAAGVLTGASPQEAQFRCQLYASYFERQLATSF